MNPLEMPIAPEKTAAFLQERGASAKRTQANFRKGLMSSSPSPAPLFSIGSENREINSRVLFSNTLMRQTWEDLFLNAIKISRSVKQNLN